MLGLLPPLVRTLQLKQELAGVQSDLSLSHTRDLAALTYLEVSRNNFGLAAKHASVFYERLSALADSGEEPGRSLAIDALKKRDTVMAMLAKADPAARTELQDLTGRLLSARGNETATPARIR